MSEFDDFLSRELENLRSMQRFRDSSSFINTSYISKSSFSPGLVSFCSNDYLGLAKHPAICSSVREFLERGQFGSGASRAVSGEALEHLALEESLSNLVGLPATLSFSSGYAANLGAISSLVGPEDIVFVDRQVHASIVDGCRLSKAKLVVYEHINDNAVEKLLSRFSSSPGRKLLVTESVFSMSGMHAPLKSLSDMCKEYGAIFYVDEAHSIGTLGHGGRGSCHSQNVVPDILIGTLGKALGTFGAFASGSKNLREFLVNRARSFLFSTAVPPSLAVAAKTGVILAASEEGEALRRRLFSRISLFRKRLSLPEQSLPSPIIPWVLGGEKAALEASSSLKEHGFFVQAIRPPTVREGKSRLRITFSALHSDEDVEKLVEAIKALSFPTSASDFCE